MDNIYLRPGQSVVIPASLRVRGAFSDRPKICISYIGNEGLARNNYVDVPISYSKFFAPIMLGTDEAIREWNSHRDGQVQETFYLRRDEMKTLGGIVSAGQIGGCLASVRGVDQNPRGCVFGGRNGDHIVLARIELGSADWAGPLMCRITVRSGLISISKSIFSNLKTILD